MRTLFAHYEPRGRQQHYAEALVTGCREHGMIARAGQGWEPADVMVLWGDRVAPPFHDGPVLYLEAGYVNGASGDYVRDRLRYVSTGWGGLHGRAAPLEGELDPQRRVDQGWTLADPVVVPDPDPDAEDPPVVLLCGQHPGDAAAAGADFDAILAELLRRDLGYPVRFRPHPLVARRQGSRARPIAADLEQSALCVTWSSTAAVEAVLAGVPTVTLSDRSIAWPVSAHSLDDPWTDCAAVLEEREAWADMLAWRQWTHSELRDGRAWEFLSGQVPG